MEASGVNVVARFVAMGDGCAAGKCAGLGARLLGSFLLLAIIRASVATPSTLTVPSTYTVFEGDLPVSYSISEPLTNHELIEVQRLDDGQLVATTDIPRGFSEAELTFDCGALDSAGQYAFRLLDRPNGSVIADGGLTRVNWPRVTLALPAQLTILSDDVTITSSVDETGRCDSARKDTAYELVLVFRAENEFLDETGALSKTGGWNETAVEVETRVLGTISMVERTQVTFRCTVFDRIGFYQVVLRSNRNRGNPVATSNTLVVNDDDAHRIQVNHVTVFPCSHHVTVNFIQPKCSSQEDKIRLFRLSRDQTGRETPVALHKLKLDHVTDRRIVYRAPTFSCSSFNTDEVGYCFRYGAVTQTGNTIESGISCLATTNTSADRIVAEWNSWSEWGPCGGNCRSGTRQRFRSCNNPYPGIRNCSGTTHENSTCKSTCLDEHDAWTMAPQCTCGCTLTNSEGVIMTSSKCTSLSIWRISVPRGKVVRLEFRVFKLKAENQATWVRIRDGDQSIASPLMRSTGGVLPAATTTTQNEMIIEYMGPTDRKKNEYDKEEEGFVAKYTTSDHPIHFLGNESPGKGQGAWETAVTIIGVLLFVVIVVGAIVFVCRRQLARRCLRAKLTHTPAHEALLGRGTADPANRNASFPDVVLPLEENGSKRVRLGQRPLSQAEAKSRSSVSSGFLSGSMTNSGHEQTYSSGEALFPAGHHTETSEEPGAPQEPRSTGRPSRRGHRKSRIIDDGRETLPLDVYPKRTTDSAEDGCRPHEKRPPVEGDDEPLPPQETALDPPTLTPEIPAVHKSKSSPSATLDASTSKIQQCRGTNFQNLELDDLSRPKNSEEKDVLEATTPQSDTSSLVLPQRDPDLDFITNDEFEYDDYIPELPGSYLTMDQPGYTLTWSKHHL